MKKIKETITKTKYFISEFIKHKFEIADKDHKITMKYTEGGNIRLLNYNERDFDFDNEFCEETLDKWEAVINLMLKAIKLARERLYK